MTSLPIRFWNAGIMAVSVGPGLMQLIRMPCLPSSGYHQPTHASMMYFESASPLHDHFSSCSRNHSTAASKPLVANNSEITGMWPCHPIAAEDEMTLIAEPSDIFGTSSSARWRAPTKFTRMVSHSLNGGPGSPAQLNRPSTGPSIEAAACSMLARSRRSMSRARATGTVVGLISRAVTVAPRSTRIFAVAWPMPDAAPVTTTDFPSYPKTSSTTSSLHSAAAQDAASMPRCGSPRTILCNYANSYSRRLAARRTTGAQNDRTCDGVHAVEPQTSTARRKYGQASSGGRPPHNGDKFSTSPAAARDAASSTDRITCDGDVLRSSSTVLACEMFADTALSGFHSEYDIAS